MIRYRILLPVLGIGVLAGCAGPKAPKPSTGDSLSTDTAIRAALVSSPDSGHRADSSRDSSIAAQLKAKQDSSERALQAAYDQYIDRYTTPFVIDTSFKIAASRFKLHLEHVCTFDTGIIVPRSYIPAYKLDSFVTHDFVTRIKLQKNGKKILDRTVTKKDFWLQYQPELAKYGVLFCPNVQIYLGTITLNYNIAIPLTDVGAAAEATIDEKGGMRFKVGD